MHHGTILNVLMGQGSHMRWRINEKFATCLTHPSKGARNG